MEVERRVGLLVASSILAGSQKHSFQLTNQVKVQTPRKRTPLSWVVKKRKGIQEEEKYFHVISHSREHLIISKEIDN